LPVVATLGLALFEIVRDSDQPRLPCPLYPNAVVAFAAQLHEGCPLEAGDSILAMDVGGRMQPIDSAPQLEDMLRTGVAASLSLRRTSETTDRRFEIVPIVTPASESAIQLASTMLLATVLVSFVLFTVVRAGVPADLPFALVHSSLGVLFVAAVAGWTSSLSYPLTALAHVILPASLIHLAFVFPRMRAVAVRVPGIHRVTYGVALVFLTLELRATYFGAASTMLLLQRIESVATVVAILLLCFSSWLSMRESPSRLERGQARVFLIGVSVLMGCAVAVDRLLPGGSLTAATLGAALSPLPLGYAIASHHLFAFDTTWRRSVSHVVYLSIWSGLFFVGVVLLRDQIPIPFWLRSPVVLYGAVYAVLTPLDAFRQTLKHFIERAFQIRSKAWDSIAEGRAVRLSHLRRPDDIARTAAELAAEGAPNAGIALFLGDRSAPRLAHALGPGASRNNEIAGRCIELYGAAEAVVDLNRVDTIEPEVLEVWDSGVEVIAPIRTDGRVHGVLLVSPAKRGRLQPSARLTWLRMVCLHAATAFEHARLAEQLRVAEEFAIRGRMHAELAHEIGKPLGALEVMAQRLSSDPDASRAVRDRANAVSRIAGQLRDIVRGVLGAGRSDDRVEVTDLIERACREIASVHGEGKVGVRPVPELPSLDRQADRALRALTNLIDNAIRASAGDVAVEIAARPCDLGVEIVIIDHGAGIAADELERVFEAFVSLRPGGNGLGLTISRQIVEQLGGTLALESAPGEGTTARLRLPARRIPD
jgi:signal transduction histidine kinase